MAMSAAWAGGVATAPKANTLTPAASVQPIALRIDVISRFFPNVRLKTTEELEAGNGGINAARWRILVLSATAVQECGGIAARPIRRRCGALFRRHRRALRCALPLRPALELHRRIDRIELEQPLRVAAEDVALGLFVDE